MTWHIFVTTTKERTPDEVTNREMDEMRAMKNSVPAIQVVTVAGGLGWVGLANVVTMTADAKDKAGSDTPPASPVRCEVVDKTIEASHIDSFVMAQIELQSVSQKRLCLAGGTVFHAKADKRAIGKDENKEGRFE